ncbi:MAG: cobalamin-binding protein [Firmicutes bacterium]|nr:cobalamin-binding protein [Bacillota bacterium]
MTDLARALRDLDEDKVLELVEEELKKEVSPLDIIAECHEGMAAVGDLFAAGKYFISDLMLSAEIMQNVMARLEPLIASLWDEEHMAGTFVIGTVSGDLHDIGKNIVVALLRSNGFKVVDLGVDVPAAKFVEMVRETGAKVLGLSALLSTTYPEMKKVIDALAAAGLREQVKVIIGGAIVNEEIRKMTGADAYAADAMTGVEFARKVYLKNKSGEAKTH